MAYTKTIKKNSIDSHQTAPAYMLTFMRWSNRDTTNFNDADFLELRQPLIVINDCVQLSVSSTKNSYIHQASMVLMGGDINYQTAIAPGDYVLINMLDDDSHLFGKGKGPNDAEATSLYVKARSLKPINGSHDGFKGVFKIQSVRKVLQVNPESGTKTLHYQITAGAFTEFNQVVYFNPYIADPNQNDLISGLLNLAAHSEWSQRTKTLGTLDGIFTSLVGFLIGTGFGELNDKIQKSGVTKNFNKNFLMPPKVASLMGIESSIANPINAASFFNYYIGIQKYTNTKTNQESLGLNPEHSTNGRYFLSKQPPTGVTPIQAEPFAQVTAWSVLNQYSNSLMNEMYTSFKLTPTNKVMPCVVFRQKPFTSKKFSKEKSNIPATEFLSLPRWKVSLDLIKTISLGRDEAARINFVHIVGKTRYVNLQDQAAQQASSNSHRFDANDIKRNGLKPFIASCDFDFPTDNEKRTQSPIWNELMFDWLSNGHLKENGTIVTVGIEEPIAVGDNLELEDTVYHIEGVTHAMHIDASGRKAFDTTLKLSYGVDKRDRLIDPIYPEMQFTDAESYRKDNFNRGHKSMPGFSDSQDIGGRVNGEEITPTKEKAFSTVPKTTPTEDEK